MSIASLFKPVDSSKTRLPRTDVLERVAKYADGKSVVSNYFDISTEELINMLRKDLVPESEIEYVSDIVRTRLSGETTATPKKSVGETISTKPIKDFTVSSPTKDFVTPESVVNNAKGFIDASSAPSGFERGNYLESLIGSGETGGAPQRGSPAKDKDYTDPLNARPDAPPARLGLEGPTPGRRPSGGMSYTPEAPEDSASIRQAALGSAEDRQNALDFLKKNQAVIDYYSKQRGEDPTRTTTSPEENKPKQDYFARLRSGGARPEGEASGFPAASQSQIDAYKLKPDADRVARGLESIMAENLGGSDAIKVDTSPEPTEASILADQYRQYNAKPSFSEELGLRGLVGGAKYLAKQPPSGSIDREVPKNRQYTPSDSALKNAITGLVYGSEGVAEAKRAPEEELKRRAAAADKATTDRMNAREAGISALPSSTGGAAEADTGGVAPRGVDPTGIGRDSTPTPAFIAGTDPTRTTTQPSATPTAAPDTSTAAPVIPDTSTAAPVIPDKPTKDDVADIKKAANEVAKNPSVGGIQSLFEQAGFSDTLLQLGLGMMASKNPDFLGSLGEAGQGAVALMAKQREAAIKAKDDADKLALETRRVAAQEADVKNRGDADKTPPAMKAAKYLADATIIAKTQKAAGQFGTPEQLYVMNQTRSDLASTAEKAGQSSSNNWQSGMNKILAMDSDTKRAKEAKAAALEQYYKTNGSTAEEAYNQGIARNLSKFDPDGLLNIGIAPVTEKTNSYDPITKTIISK